MRRISIAALLMLLLAFCVGAAPSRGSAKGMRGIIRRQCGPADGPALGLYLASKPFACGSVRMPHISIGIWDDLPTSAPKTYVIRPSAALGISRCSTADACINATAGKLTFDTLQNGKGASGSYEFEFADGRRESGRFDVTWCEYRELCG